MLLKLFICVTLDNTAQHKFSDKTESDLITVFRFSFVIFSSHKLLIISQAMSGYIFNKMRYFNKFIALRT